MMIVAFRNLWRHTRRTVMVGASIGLVSFLMVVLLSAVSGIKDGLRARATSVATGHLNVGALHKLSPGSASAVLRDPAAVEQALRSELPAGSTVVARTLSDAQIASDKASLLPMTTVVGVDLAAEPGFVAALGKAEGDASGLGGPGAAVIYRDQAERLGVTVGDVITVRGRTLRGVENALDLKVSAVVQAPGLLSAPRIFVSAGTVRELHQHADGSVGVLQIRLPEDAHRIDLADLRERLGAALTGAGYSLVDSDPNAWTALKGEAVTRGWVGERFYVTTWEDEFAFLRDIWGLVSFLVGLVSLLLFSIVSLGVMNTLWLAVRERTQEIGTLRAIGMPRLSVVGMFLSEGFLLGLLASLGGAAVGAVASGLLSLLRLPAPESLQFMLGMGTHLAFSVKPGAVFASVLVVTASTTLVSMLPSYLAARLRPVTAIHRVG